MHWLKVYFSTFSVGLDCPTIKFEPIRVWTFFSKILFNWGLLGSDVKALILSSNLFFDRVTEPWKNTRFQWQEFNVIVWVSHSMWHGPCHRNQFICHQFVTNLMLQVNWIFWNRSIWNYFSKYGKHKKFTWFLISSFHTHLAKNTFIIWSVLCLIKVGCARDSLVKRSVSLKIQTSPVYFF